MIKIDDLALEYRMYGLVPYNISPIQQGIQFGHAVVRYGRQMESATKLEKLIYDIWADVHQTFIILNGKTTNENPVRFGTLQQHATTLKANGIVTAEFREPDLNDTLTAVVFLVDERVFNREKYPDYEYDLAATHKDYLNWITIVGGEKNAFLREFLPQFKMA